MPDWPAGSGGRIAEVGAVPASSTGVQLTTGSPAHTKGAWEEVTASTPFTCSAFILTINFALATYLVDVGIGVAGSEVVLVGNIHYSGQTLVPFSMLFPMRIPTGSRIAVRSQGSATGSVTSTTMYLLNEGFTGPVGRNRCITYGADTSDSGGTVVDPGTTLHTKGAWTQITASTTADHKGLAIIHGSRNNTAMAGATFFYDIAVGASGQEQIIIANWRVTSSVNETISPQNSPFFPVDIPAGSRIAVRCSGNTTDATDRLLDVVLYALT